MAKYKYLTDTEMLNYIDDLAVKIQYTKLTLLSRDELPLYEITGLATSGSISVNSNSSVRRTGSVSLIAGTNSYDAIQLDALIGEAKSYFQPGVKVAVETGFENTGHLYPQYKIFWFPLGIFVVGNPSIAHNAQGLQISINLNDKMSLLNGENGGSFPTAITHSPIQELSQTSSQPIERKPLLKDLMHTLLTKTGGLTEQEIQLSDIPVTRLNSLVYNGKNNAYLTKIEGSDYQYTLTSGTINASSIEVHSGERIGKFYTEYTFPAELITHANESIETALNQIKNSLGHKEYFFDTEGIFHFRELRDFILLGSDEDEIADALAALPPAPQSYAVCELGNKLFNSCSNNKAWTSIKNDIVACNNDAGEKQYHLVIDEKPQPVTKESTWYVQYAFRKEDEPIRLISASMKGTTNTDDLPSEAPLTYKAGETKYCKGGVVYVAIRTREQAGDDAAYNEDDWAPETITLTLDKDGRSSDDNRYRSYHRNLYFQAMDKKTQGLELSIFEQEIIAKIPTMINIVTGDSLPGATYHLEIIDPRTSEDNIPSLEPYMISKIGRRVKTIIDSDISHLKTVYANIYETVGKEIIFVKTSELLGSNIINELIAAQTPYCIVEDSQWGDSTSAKPLRSIDSKKSAKDVLRSALHQNIFETSSITLTTVPLYYLDVNQRVAVKDEDSKVNSDYIITSMSVPLSANGMMTIQAVEAINMI